MYNSRPTYFIKKNSTLPKIKFGLSEYLMLRYDITEDMLDNCAITFSMQNAETGIYRIANRAADLVVNTDFALNPDDDKYSLVYKFSIADTSIPGVYLGEFKIDFLGEDQCGSIDFPIDNKLTIVINDSITKTTILKEKKTPPVADNVFDETFDYTFS